MKGYKIFNPDWTCRGFQYEVGKTFEMDGDIAVCSRGFHFYTDPMDLFNYYDFNPENKVAKIEALGNIKGPESDSKHCTSKISIVEEVKWEDVLRLVNTGKGNSGYRNSGGGNSGGGNSGDRNSGDWNSGYRNSGDRNSGDRNSGYRNSGDRNSGDRNSGDRNSGNYNFGDHNSGDFNLSDNNAGCFNTEENAIKMFDQDTNITLNEWRRTRAFVLLCRIDVSPTKWIYSEDMTEEEKKQHPDYETLGGYLKKLDITNAYQNWWESLDNEEKQVIKDIPNFDAGKFEKITGIKVG